jgi:adenylate cyclase
MSLREFHYRWESELRASPEELWPLVSDTNRFNRDAGLPALDAEAPAGGPEGAAGAGRRLRFSKFGVRVEWEEEPFEWVRPARFGVRRRYFSGPVAEMRVQAELREREGGGTLLTYEIWAAPRGALGRAAIPVQIGRLAARKFAQVFRRYDEMAARGLATHSAAPVRLSASRLELLASLAGQLVEAGADARLAALLVETIKTGDDAALGRLRPYALADEWGVARRDALELCLRATRAGLLDLRWELLCPHCRGAGETARALCEVRPTAHCAGCDADYSVAFDRSVEVVFRPNPAVREVEARSFCMGGPRVAPHVVVQQRLEPGERRELTPALEPGRYRLAARDAPGERLVLVSEGGEGAATLRCGAEGWAGGELSLSERPALALENATDRRQLFALERAAWGDGAATAAEVTTLQLFRDLFASEALRPGDRISVGQMTILFTDLRNSTRLYREIGDAVAFGAVMNHFDVLREEIAAEGGSIVKTLGDAVMAAFPRPAPALRAVTRAQRILASPPAGVRPFVLKAGVHTGPCIAVTLNGRLDYFGSNVNIAARLEPLSTGSDCVITAAVRHDPEVAAMLEDAGGELSAEQTESQLKGFDEECFLLWRVTGREREPAGATQTGSAVVNAAARAAEGATAGVNPAPV